MNRFSPVTKKRPSRREQARRDKDAVTLTFDFVIKEETQWQLRKK